MKIKSTIVIVISFLSSLVGGVDLFLKVLIVFSVLDFTTGLVKAFFNKSEKSKNKGASSISFRKGLVKKCLAMFPIIVAHLTDRLLGVDYLRSVVISLFIAYEGLSVLENCALLGVPMPKVLKKALEVMKEESDGGKNE